MDLEAFPDFYSKLVPFVATMGTEFVELSLERVVLRVPDRPDLHNHLGGPHAGVQFSLGESASGIVTILNFEEALAEATPLPGRAEIRYKKVAKGDFTVSATLGKPRDDVLAEMRSEGSSWFPVEIVIATADGETGAMTVDWNLKRNS